MNLYAARDLAVSLLRQHGLHEWTFRFDHARRRFGACRYAQKAITLSRHLTFLNGDEQVRDTILHEIAHALAGPRHGHDAVWRATARRIGCSGQRCSSADAPRVEGDWVGTCAAGHRITRHRRPERPGSCRTCSPTFSAEHLFTWTYRGQPAAMTATYEAELARVLTRTEEPTLARVRVRLGDTFRISAPGSKYDGVSGTLVKRGRTRYHLQVGRSVMTVPFAMARPVTPAVEPR